MATITIKRIRYTDEGTFGSLRAQRDGHEISMMTGELPWRGNKRGVSCIPSGEYRAVLEHSAKFRQSLYELKGVPGRSEVKIHAGNFCGDVSKGLRSDVEGCILVGEQHGTLHGQRAVLTSRAALARLHEFLAGVGEVQVVVIGDPRQEV